jgi:hypothetical protein
VQFKVIYDGRSRLFGDLLSVVKFGDKILRDFFRLKRTGTKWVDGDTHITRKFLVYSVIKRSKMECSVNVAGMGEVRNPD